MCSTGDEYCSVPAASGDGVCTAWSHNRAFMPCGLLQDESAAPPHSPEALQEVAREVASMLRKDEPEVSALLQRSSYGTELAPAPLPDTEQASCIPSALSHPDVLVYMHQLQRPHQKAGDKLHQN